MRVFRRFSHKDADYRISSREFNTVCSTIVKERVLLENYIKENENFLLSMTPLPDLPDSAPLIAKKMNEAAILTDVGPMAAVAGTIAQLAAEKAAGQQENSQTNIRQFEGETIVENGGDIFMVLKNELVLGIHSGVKVLEGKLAFKIKPEDTPLAVCSSSSTMGHSVSLGNCNLTTVFSKSGALADTAATKACNMVKSTDDIPYVLEFISAIPGITGLIIIKGDKVGIAGDLPEIVSNSDPELISKITHHKKSSPV